MKKIKYKSVDVGLISGRHQIPCASFIYHKTVPPMDFDYLYEVALDYVRSLPREYNTICIYMTGLTSASLSLVRACQEEKVNLIAYHWDREKKEYVPQNVLTGF